MDAGLEVRSWRRVYRLERRLYSIPNGRGYWRLPVPGGVPLWGAAYFTAGMLAMLALRSLPVMGALAGMLPAPGAFTFVPAALALCGARYRPHGRMPHRHWCSLLTERWAGEHFYGEQPVDGDGKLSDDHTIVTLAPGPEWPQLIDVELTGPVIVHAREALRVRARGRRRVLLPAADAVVGVRVLRLAAGERAVIRAGRGEAT